VVEWLLATFGQERMLGGGDILSHRILLSIENPEINMTEHNLRLKSTVKKK
jgi:hypothetical protein